MPHVDSPQTVCRFGLARCDVTPPVRMYHRMWGAAAHDRSTGIHRPLEAAAIAIAPEDGSAPPIVLVALDHCLFWGREMDAFRSRVAEHAEIEPGRLVVTFSHTHAAGLIDLSRTDLPGGELLTPYFEWMIGEVAGIARRAVEGIETATVVYGSGRCGLAAHRDFFDVERGEYACGFNPHGAHDETVLVARVSAADGRTLATFVNYACHPTTLAWQNTLVSPDYPGAMRELVERQVGAPCVFLQGASGDLGPREGFVGDTKTADRNGRQLAYAALAAIETLSPPGTRFEYTGPVVSGATLGTWRHAPLDSTDRQKQARFEWRTFTVELSYRDDLPTADETAAERDRWLAAEAASRRDKNSPQAAESRAMVERMTRRLTRLAELPQGETFALPVALGFLGDAVWVGVEGEHYQYLQRELRGRFPRTPIVLFTLMNGSRCSYLPTADVYGEGIYQESIALLAPGSLEALCEAIAVEIRKVIGAGM